MSRDFDRQVTELDAGGDLILAAGYQYRDDGSLSATGSPAKLTLVGSELLAAGGIGLRSSGVIELAGAKDADQLTWYQKKKSGFLGSKKKVTTGRSYDEVTRTVQMTGQNVTISAGADIIAAGPKIKAAGDLRFDADGKLLLGSYDDRHSFEETTRTSRWWGLMNDSQSETRDLTDATGANLFAGANLGLVTTSGDITLKGSKLAAGNGILIDPGSGRLVMDSLTDKLARYRQDVDDNGITITTVTERWYDETADHASVTAPVVSLGKGDRVTLNLVGDSKAAADLYLAALPQTLREHVTSTDLTLLTHSYDYDKQVALNPAFKALMTIVVSSVIMPGISFGSLQGWQLAAARAGTSSLITGSLEGAITGDFDIGKILEGAAFSAVSAGLTSGIDAKHLGMTGLPQKSLLGAGKHFSIANIVESGVDNLITAGLSSAVYGTDFLDSFKASMLNSIISLATADMQTLVGDQGWTEGSAQHVLAHAFVGCASIELQGGDCAAGAAAGAAQAIYAGWVDGTYDAQALSDPAKRARLASTASLIGGIVGTAFSGGNAANVSGGAAIAQSGFENNYLTHEQIDAFGDQISTCKITKDPPACVAAVEERYAALSAANRAEMLACKTAECWGYHADRMAQAQSAMLALYEMGHTGRHDFIFAGAAGFVQREQSLSGYAMLTTPGAVEAFAAWGTDHCGGVIDAACRSAFAQSKTMETITAAAALGLEFIPGVGDAMAVIDCAKQPSLNACLGAAAGLVPVLGDATRLILRRGDKVLEVTRKGDELVAPKGGGKLPPNKSGYTQADYDAYVARKEAAGETPRSPEEYIARREQLDQNRLEGARRQEKYRQEMADIYGKENVLTERYLRDADGNIVKDPDTGEARRLDCVVVNGKCGYAAEVTSPTADKDPQITKEENIREAGGIYVENPNTGELIEVTNTSEVIRLE